jgi:hypothetical protein
MCNFNGAVLNEYGYPSSFISHDLCVKTGQKSLWESKLLDNRFISSCAEKDCLCGDS